MTDRAGVRAVFIGTGQFGVPALRWLASEASRVHLAGIVTAPARPAGRRGELRHGPVAAVAEEVGIAPLTPARLRDAEAIDAVMALRPDVVVLADYGQIVPEALLDLPFGALNLHPSLLPRHRGAIPVPAAILAGDRRTGVTLMRMDRGLDTGPIVAVDPLDLRGDETTPDLEGRLSAAGATLLGRSLGPWLRGELEARAQPADGATLTRQLRREDGRLDPSAIATTLERQVRALQPWPGSWLDLPDGRLVVWRIAVELDSAETAGPGTLRVVDGRLLLGAVDGALELLEVQPAGGRRMPGPAFARGRLGLDVVIASGAPRPPIERPVGYSPGP